MQNFGPLKNRKKPIPYIYLQLPAGLTWLANHFKRCRCRGKFNKQTLPRFQTFFFHSNHGSYHKFPGSASVIAFLLVFISRGAHFFWRVFLLENPRKKCSKGPSPLLEYGNKQLRTRGRFSTSDPWCKCAQFTMPSSSAKKGELSLEWREEAHLERRIYVYLSPF